MATGLTLRATKGSALTHTELDTNLKISKGYDTVAEMLAASDTFTAGTYITAGGFRYQAVASGGDLQNAGSQHIDVAPWWSVTPDMWGADNTGSTVCTTEFNAAMQYAVANNVPGYSNGIYLLDGTLAPGGEYSWDWQITTLRFYGVTAADLTDVMYNPSTGSYSDSGKGVCFDTKDCGSSRNNGSLTIAVSAPGNMRLASRASIPADVVAITASEGSSADIVWSHLFIIGADHGLYQGSMSGTAANMLPYTRWTFDYLQIQFCTVAMESGSGGNGFDDMWLSNLRITRCGGTSTIRATDLHGGIAFINGLGPGGSQDAESQTISTTAGSTSATLSADNTDIIVGTVLVIDGAGSDKAGTAMYHTTRVAAKTGTAITLESAAEKTVAGATFVCNPPRILMQTSSWTFQQTYLEECHQQPMELYSRSRITGQIKVSNGDCSSLYKCGILLNDDSSADISLHEKSTANQNVGAVVGVFSQRNGASYNSNYARVKGPRIYSEASVNSDWVKIVTAVSGDLLGGWGTDASGEHNPNLRLIGEYMDRTVEFQRHGYALDGSTRVERTLPAFITTGNGGLETTGAVLISAASGYGGNCSDPSGGSSSKTSGGTGYVIHDVTAGTSYRVAISFSSWSAGTPSLRWYNSTTLDENEGIFTRSDRRSVVYITAPAGVDKLRLWGGTNDVWTCDEFTISEVLSI